MCPSKEFIAENSTPSCVWSDAHDDYNTPDVLASGNLDSVPVAMLKGDGWKTLLASIPGFRPMSLKKGLVQAGMRDVTEPERTRVLNAGFSVVWGDEERRVDFEGELEKTLSEKSFSSTIVPS